MVSHSENSILLKTNLIGLKGLVASLTLMTRHDSLDFLVRRIAELDLTNQII